MDGFCRKLLAAEDVIAIDDFNKKLQAENSYTYGKPKKMK